MVYGRQDVTRDFEGIALTIPDVAGWFCMACDELEFDSSESARSFLEQVTVLQQQRRSMCKKKIIPINDNVSESIRE